MISMLGKEACSGSIHDLAHIPIQDCLTDCLTKISAKTDNLITFVKTGKLLDVDIHFDFRTLLGHKAFLPSWCKTFLHTSEKEVSFLNTLKISLSQTSQKGPFQIIFVKLSSKRSKKKRKHVSVRSRCYENKVCSRRAMHPISWVSDADFDDCTDVDEPPSRISHRKSMMQDLSDSTSLLSSAGENVVSVFGSYEPFA